MLLLLKSTLFPKRYPNNGNYVHFSRISPRRSGITKKRNSSRLKTNNEVRLHVSAWTFGSFKQNEATFIKKLWKKFNEKN